MGARVSRVKGDGATCVVKGEGRGGRKCGLRRTGEEGARVAKGGRGRGMREWLKEEGGGRGLLGEGGWLGNAELPPGGGRAAGGQGWLRAVELPLGTCFLGGGGEGVARVQGEV
eukprot:359071-Chlamydomonas_euryale.AAC.8